MSCDNTCCRKFIYIRKRKILSVIIYTFLKFLANPADALAANRPDTIPKIAEPIAQITKIVPIL